MTGASGRPVLVCFAVREEAAPFRRGLPAHVTVLVTGMGPAAAELAARTQLAARDWGLVLTCGFAGALDPALTRGTVLLDADPAFPLHVALRTAGARPARFHCAQRVATTALEKATLRERTGADAVEMESGIIRELCRQRGLPAATVRVISDTADENLPLDFNALVRPDGKLSLPRLAGAVLRRPRQIPALMALGRHSQAAARRLAAVLRAALAAT